MSTDRTDAPPPDLRIVPTTSLQPHEEHDSQRAEPLIERLRTAPLFTNPPVAAPLDADTYVILDGANRCYAFGQLHYPHILIQLVSYDSGYVDLKTWRHIISAWDIDALLAGLARIHAVEISSGPNAGAIAHIHLRDGRLLAVCTPLTGTHQRHAALREVVRVYQRSAVLHRTALTEPNDIWPLYPDSVALVVFPHCQPADILAAARHQAFMPPGISRHIIHGRALKMNYPFDLLRDLQMPLSEKNDHLRRWVQNKLANRQVRYYAEATYQFDE
jgi:hypothetical protein